jgi:hypothetical protein
MLFKQEQNHFCTWLSTPWRCISEWRHSFTYSYHWHDAELSDYFHDPLIYSWVKNLSILWIGFCRKKNISHSTPSKPNFPTDSAHTVILYWLAIQRRSSNRKSHKHSTENFRVAEWRMYECPSASVYLCMYSCTSVQEHWLSPLSIQV